MLDRLGYALAGLVLGALIGVAGWWLYGLAHSLRFDGPGIDPVLRHWVQYAGAGSAVLGFLFRERLLQALGDVVAAVLHFEWDQAPERTASSVMVCVLLVLMMALLWWTCSAAR